MQHEDLTRRIIASPLRACKDYRMIMVKDGTRLITVNVRQILSAIESESQRRQSATTINNIYVAGNVNDSNLLAGNDNEADIIPAKSVKNKKK